MLSKLKNLYYFDKKYFWLLIAVLMSGFLLRLGYMLLFSSNAFEADEPYYHQAAINIVNGEGFHGESYFAYLPPLYSYFVAGVYYLFGVDFFM